jgi:hypothetical protein
MESLGRIRLLRTVPTGCGRLLAPPLTANSVSSRPGDLSLGAIFPTYPPSLYPPSMSQPQTQPRQDTAKDANDHLEFEELGLLPDAPPVPSLCGVPLKYIS